MAEPENTGKKQVGTRLNGAKVPSRRSGNPAPGTRSDGGKFASGLSGNPSGRPKGAKNRVTLIAQDLLEGDGEAVMAKAIEMAKAGDPVALRLCVERILPRSRGAVIEFALPDIQKAEDLAGAVRAAIEAAAAGKISLAEASEFLALLDVQRRVIETEDLAVRVQLLERRGRDR